MANLLGVLTIFIIRRLDFMPELVYECAQPIIENRDAELWYQHIVGGIGCGICIQMAVINWAKKHEPLGVILPVALFILCGFKHTIADAFYYCWSAFEWRHLLQIFEVFIGNCLGAFIVLPSSVHSLPHVHL